MIAQVQGMMGRGVSVLLAWVVLAGTVGAAHQAAVPAVQQTLQVTPLTRDGSVLVSFKLADAFTDDLRAAIQSGMTITFLYDVELKRGASLWLDRTIGTVTISASVKFDNLTRRYYVTIAKEGRIDSTEPTDSEATARRWLTEFNRLPLFSSAGLEANGEYYVRVRARTTPKSASFVWPWASHDVTGNAKFTFLR